MTFLKASQLSMVILAVVSLGGCAPEPGQTPATPTVPPAPTARFSAPARPAEPTSALGSAAPTSRGRPSVRIIAEVAPPPVGILSEVDTEVEFVTALTNAEAIHDLAAGLRSVPGIFELRGDEHAVTVIYDSGQVTVVQIREAFARLGAPAKNVGIEIVDPGVAAD